MQFILISSRPEESLSRQNKLYMSAVLFAQGETCIKCIKSLMGWMVSWAFLFVPRGQFSLTLSFGKDYLFDKEIKLSETVCLLTSLGPATEGELSFSVLY